MDQKINYIFLLGLVFGLILKWSDIIPILGGFILGLSCRKIPEMINLNEYLSYIKDNINTISQEKLRKKNSNL